MASDRKIKEAVRKLADTHDKTPVTYMACTVTAVDISTRTCTVDPAEGKASTEIVNVELMTEVDDGWLLIPVVGSTVIVCYCDKRAPYVALFSAIQSARLITQDGIQLEDGTFGGLCKAEELQTQLNKTNQLLNAILNVINGAPIDEPGSGAPSALQIALKTALTGKTLGDYANIINSKITHGT